MRSIKWVEINKPAERKREYEGRLDNNDKTSPPAGVHKVSNINYIRNIEMQLVSENICEFFMN